MRTNLFKQIIIKWKINYTRILSRKISEGNIKFNHFIEVKINQLNEDNGKFYPTEREVPTKWKISKFCD